MKNIKFAVLSLSALVLSISCKEERIGIPDTGDLKMGIVVPGNESVTVCVDLKDGSKATKAEVTWGEGKSASLDISGGKIQKRIAVTEGSYIFRVSAYDAGGKKVIDFPIAGRAYGASYVGTLKNSRVPMKFRLNKDKDVNITWADNPLGCIRTVLTYNKVGETEPVTVSVSADNTTTVLEKPVIEVDPEGVEVFRFKVMGYYYPDVKLLNPETRPASVPSDIAFDEFPSTTTDYDNGPVDVTSVYIKNPGPGFEASEIYSGDTRWGNLSGWQTNDVVKNQGGNAYGGWKGGGLGWETGWNGASSITNGKVWQSPTLPSGTYELTISFGGIMDENLVDLFLVVADGSVLPDIANIAKDAIVYTELNNPGGERTLTFKLTEDKKVSIGIVITATGEVWVDAVNWFKLVDLKQYDD